MAAEPPLPGYHPWAVPKPEAAGTTTPDYARERLRTERLQARNVDRLQRKFEAAKARADATKAAGRDLNAEYQAQQLARLGIRPK